MTYRENLYDGLLLMEPIGKLGIDCIIITVFYISGIFIIMEEFKEKNIIGVYWPPITF